MDPDADNPFRTKHRYYPQDKRFCPVCLGMRYLAYDVPYSDPLFSRLLPCPRCNTPTKEEPRR